MFDNSELKAKGIKDEQNTGIKSEQMQIIKRQVTEIWGVQSRAGFRNPRWPY